MSGNDELKRAAVVVRAHMADEKTLDLLERLSGSALFDLYVAANETAGAIDFGVHRKLAHTGAVLRPFGLPENDDYLLRHLSDAVLHDIRRQAPGYALYVLVEYDVHPVRGDAAVFEALVRALSGSAFRDVDLAAPLLRPSNPSWFWHRGAAELFAEPWGIFFPVVAVSARALDALYEARRAEAALRRAQGAGERGRDWVFCEAFIPSALHAAGGFRMADLREVLPDCYRPASFHGTPMLLGDVTPDASVELIHPVVAGRDFLIKAVDDAERWGRLPVLLADLRAARWTLPPELVAEFETLATARLSAGA